MATVTRPVRRGYPIAELILENLRGGAKLARRESSEQHQASKKAIEKFHT
jgi:hypothetical protein